MQNYMDGLSGGWAAGGWWAERPVHLVTRLQCPFAPAITVISNKMSSHPNHLVTRHTLSFRHTYLVF